jgi:gamma-glutamyltranspeptidase/glutathione hydrolase
MFLQSRTAVRLFVAIAAATLLAACQQAAPRGAPVAASRLAGSGVAAANPRAVEAGLEILRAGGSAVDAAVAVQAMLGLVEPQSSGIGGGAFLLYYDAAARQVTAFNGRETAPQGATADMFVGADGKALGYSTAVTSGRSTGVPGAMPMLGKAHEKFGHLPWNALFEPAIRAAEDGIDTPKRLARFANSQFAQASAPDVRGIFARPDGSPIQVGDPFRNPAYGATLRKLATQGSRALHSGDIAAAIVARTRAEPLPGTMTLDDLEDYRPVVSEAICGPYRVYLVCVPPPPSSGVALLQVLAILDRTDIAERGPDDPQAWFLFAEASRLMYADRDRYVADPAFVPVPVAGLLAPDYIAARARLIGDHAGPPPVAGEPQGVRRGADATHEPGGTSHFVIVDAAGNAVSMTTTVESLFGSGRAVGGFMLNNQLTDFSLQPVEDGVVAANAVAGGKRPRSSMAPTVVLDRGGRLVAVIGSPGGSAILAYNAKALVGLLAWKLPLQQAIDLPNLVARGDAFFGEATKFPPAVLQGLAARGVEVKPGRGEESGLHGVVVRDGGRLEGAADPRREGIWREVPP